MTDLFEPGTLILGETMNLGQPSGELFHGPVIEYNQPTDCYIVGHNDPRHEANMVKIFGNPTRLSIMRSSARRVTVLTGVFNLNRWREDALTATRAWPIKIGPVVFVGEGNKKTGLVRTLSHANIYLRKDDFKRLYDVKESENGTLYACVEATLPGSDDPEKTFLPGDLVRLHAERPGFEGTVYTVAGVEPGSHGWVQLLERANGVGHGGLRRATDAREPSKTFPPGDLPDPAMNAKRRQTVEHTDGVYVRHWDDEDGRRFCPVCKSAASETRQTCPVTTTRQTTQHRQQSHTARAHEHLDVSRTLPMFEPA